MVPAHYRSGAGSCGRRVRVCDGYGGRLDPATLRRLACDAEILPALRGGPSEVLDLGRTRRLVSPAQLPASLDPTRTPRQHHRVHTLPLRM